MFSFSRGLGQTLGIALGGNIFQKYVLHTTLAYDSANLMLIRTPTANYPPT